MYQFYLYHKDLGRRQRIEDPVGWDGLGKAVERDPKWHGLFFEYTPKLRFIKTGKAILSTFFKRYDIEAEVYLIVTVKDVNTRKMVEDYRGRVNFTTFKLSTLFAECNIENLGFIQKFKNRQDVKVDLTSNRSVGDKLVNTFSRETVTLHSKTLKRNFEATAGADNIATTTFVQLTDIFNRWLKIGFYNVTKDSLSENNMTFSGWGSQSNEATQNWDFKVKEKGSYTLSVRIKGNLKIQYLNVNAIDNYEFRLLFKLPGIPTTPLLIFTSVGTASFDSNVIIDDQPVLPDTYEATKAIDHTFNTTFDLEAGDEVYIYGFSGIDFAGAGDGPAAHIFEFDEDLTSISLSGSTEFPATTAEVLPIFESFARVTEAITDQKDVFRSNYYIRTDSTPRTGSADGAGSLRGITNGGRIRGIALDKIGMYSNFKELLETCQAIDGVGVGIVKEGFKEVVEVEPISHFYKPVEVARFSNVKDIEMDVASDRYYNELEIGYKKWANEESNNLDEFASKRSYTLPVTQLQKKLVLISPYIASGYTIEYTRRDRFDLDKDRDEDNDNFIIDLARSGEDFVPAKNEDFTALTNVLDAGTVYNAKLSISRNVLRNGAQIAASLYKQENGTLRISFPEGNSAMVSQLTGEAAALNENANITISQLSKAIWINQVYTVKTKPTLAQMQAIYANPRGYISFGSDEKNYIKGFLLKAQPDQKTRETEFKLLRANL